MELVFDVREEAILPHIPPNGYAFSLLAAKLILLTKVVGFVGFDGDW